MLHTSGSVCNLYIETESSESKLVDVHFLLRKARVLAVPVFYVDYEIKLNCKLKMNE